MKFVGGLLVGLVIGAAAGALAAAFTGFPNVGKLAASA